MNLVDRAAQKIHKLFKAWNKYFPTTGMISLAAFIIAVISGIVLAIPYDITVPESSIRIMLLTNPPAAFARSVHYWSAHIFAVLTILHAFEYMITKGERGMQSGIWFRLALTVPAAFIVMLTGFILKGDGESFLALTIFDGLLLSLPLVGENLSFFILGNGEDLQIIYIHHVATTTIYLWIIIAEHARRFWPTARANLAALSATFLMTLALPVFLHDPSDPVKKGPWYFIGLQEILHWFTEPVILMYIMILLMALFMIYTRFPDRLFIFSRRFFLILFILYGIFFIIGWFFRGEGWQFVLPWSEWYPGPMQ